MKKKIKRNSKKKNSRKIKKEPKFTNLTLKDRKRIERFLGKGKGVSRIAEHLGFSKSTIGRETQRNKKVNGKYEAFYANKKALSRVKEKKLEKRKLDINKKLRKFVLGRLKKYHSPDQIVNRLKKEYPRNKNMRISMESIYDYIYIQPKGEFKKTLIRGLRQQHKFRRNRAKRAKNGSGRHSIPEMTSIHQRPKEVEKRKVPGHWEGDLILGKLKESALGTVVERTSRKVVLVRLVKKDAHSVQKAFSRRMKAFPKSFKRTLTYDQGVEMTQHKKFTKSTRMKVYFADPRSPWQRATNENTNGLLRYNYFPKGYDFSKITYLKIKRVEDLLNNRPRKVLGYLTPNEVYLKLLQ